MIGKAINKALDLINFRLVSTATKDVLPDIDRDEIFTKLYRDCAPFTMTSIERMYALYSAVNYILDANVKGDFVECGVWKGGSAMLIAKILKLRKVADRKIYLYDTFEGMTKPEPVDVSYSGEDAVKIFKQRAIAEDASDWCIAPLDEVSANMRKIGLEERQLVFVKGKVEDTMPDTLPQNGIALLRLDTDWYDSTKHELIHLYPLLVKKGVLIIDDFGHWEGARKAVLEYFAESGQSILLNRIDYTGRMGVKN